MRYLYIDTSSSFLYTAILEDENKRIITLIPYGRKYEELCDAIL